MKKTGQYASLNSLRPTNNCQSTKEKRLKTFTDPRKECLCPCNLNPASTV